jgi:5'-methylthioadenosine phosphorylase
MFNDIPPHMINHRANMLAFSKLGVDKILSITSVGSLKLELSPKEIIMPDDYINFWDIQTYFEDKIRHIIPGLDLELREHVYTKIRTLPLDIRFEGIYIQTHGPRLETKAEINMLKDYGDIVGMTMASEATMAKEIGIQYANISFIDNYCNGIVDIPLTIDAISKNQAKNIENVERILKQLIKG